MANYNSKYVNRDGTTPWVGQQSMGGKKLVRNPDGVAPEDAATYGQFKAAMIDMVNGAPIIQETTIPSGEIAIIASTPKSGNHAVRFFVALLNDTDSRYQVSEVLTLRKFGTAEFTESAIVGDSMSYEFSVLEDLENMYLKIENLEPSDIVVNLIQFIIG